MKFCKLLWGIRAICWKPFTGMGIGYVGKPIYVKRLRDLRIGKRVRIYTGLRTETVGNGKIEIGDNVSVGQNFHCSSCDEVLYIGDNVDILPNVCITNIEHNYTEIHKPINQQSLIVSHTEIGDYCCIGFGAVILAGVKLGKQCIVGANSVVRKGDYPDYSVLVGSPARVVKRYNPDTGLWEKT